MTPKITGNAYFKERFKLLNKEYKGKDKTEIFLRAGNKCSLCGSGPGDVSVFGPTHYLRKKIKFKTSLQVHIIEGLREDVVKVVLCSCCHLSYHLFNRLERGADFGGAKIK